MLAVVLAVVRACMMSERAGRTCDAACSDSIFAWCGERSERALCDERASLCSSVRGLRVGRGVCWCCVAWDWERLWVAGERNGAVLGRVGGEEGSERRLFLLGLSVLKGSTRRARGSVRFSSRMWLYMGLHRFSWVYRR